MRYKNAEASHKDHIENYRTDGVAKMKGTMYSSDYYRVQWILQNIPKDSYVLEVGCNAGTVAIQIAQTGCYVKGIDIVQELVNKAVERGIMAEQGTAEDLSRFPDNEFSVVVCAEVLEHLYDPLPAIKEAYRVLQPGGKYLVTVPHPSSQMAGEKLGDYHQNNFTIEILDTIFHSVFKRDTIMFSEIPYQKEFCIANGLNVGHMGWIGLECTK